MGNHGTYNSSLLYFSKLLRATSITSHCRKKTSPSRSFHFTDGRIDANYHYEKPASCSWLAEQHRIRSQASELCRQQHSRSRHFRIALRCSFKSEILPADCRGHLIRPLRCRHSPSRIIPRSAEGQVQPGWVVAETWK